MNPMRRSKRGKRIATIILIIVGMLSAIAVYFAVTFNNRENFKIEAVGTPLPQNDIAKLLADAPKTDINLDGVWSGTFRYYTNEEPLFYTLSIQINETDQKVSLQSIGPRSEFEQFSNITRDGNHLTFQYTGHSYNVDGTPIVFYGEAVATERGIDGTLKYVISERSHKVYYLAFDFDLERIADADAVEP